MMNHIVYRLCADALHHEASIFLTAIVDIAILPGIVRACTIQQTSQRISHASDVRITPDRNTRSSPGTRIELPHLMVAVLIGHILLLDVAVPNIILFGDIHRMTVNHFFDWHHL